MTIIKNNFLEKNIENFKDLTHKKVFTNFIENFINNAKSSNVIKTHSSFYIQLSNIISDIALDDFNWEFICNIVNLNPNLTFALRDYLVFLLDNNLYLGSNADLLQSLFNGLGIPQLKTLKLIFNKKYSPISFYVEHSFCSQSRKASRLFNLNTSNLFLREILIKFIKTTPKTLYRQKMFFYYFEDSLNSNIIASIDDFNIETFNIQFNYYKTNHKDFLQVLSNFYLFLINNYKDKEIITYRDGIDINILKRPDFSQLYSDGFRLVLFNPNENIPIIDKWILNPNGFEVYSTLINITSYKKIDFSGIIDNTFKDIAKKWFWETSASIPTKYQTLTKIIHFCNFLSNLKTEKIITLDKNDEFNLITTSEIFAYKTFILQNFDNPKNQSHYINSARLFVTFINENKLINVESGAFYYLSHNGKSANNTALSIKKDDLIIIEKKLRENAQKSYLNTLYYIAFHLSLNTEFRISQIFGLKINCVQEAMKKNQYVIVSNTKVSNGEEIEQPISIYVKRYIDELLKFSSDIRNECMDSNVIDYLFLYKGVKNLYRVVNPGKFNSYLKKICIENGLTPYTATNLRETYITNANEYALKNGWSLFDLKTLTKHKSFDTVNNSYIDKKIRSALESTYGIIIGNISLNGTILSESEINQTKENTVDDGCGICNSETCTLTSNLDCPLCNHFVVTLSTIPYLEDKIKSLSNAIDRIEIQHEKEHLYNIKRLYLAYLEKLYILKEDS